MEILLDAVKDAGVTVAEASRDALDGIGAPVDGWGADHEGTLRTRPIHGVPQALLDGLSTAVKPPRIARGPERTFAHRSSVHPGVGGVPSVLTPADALPHVEFPCDSAPLPSAEARTLIVAAIEREKKHQAR